MAISRMQQPQQMQGGLGALDAPRQGYFLGKLVKKATRAVKKVAKSPLGKAALIYAGGMGLGSIGSGLTGMARFAPSNFMSNMGNIGGFLKGGLGNFKAGTKGTMGGGFSDIFRKGGKTGEDFSMGRLLAGGLGATALAAPFLMGKDEPEEVEEVMDVANIRNRARNFYSGQGDAGVGLEFMAPKKYVNQNFYTQNAAEGGRIGYAMGGSLDDEEEEIAFARTNAGQSRRQPMAFLAMGGDAGNAQAEQMLMAEFVKYKNKGGDLSFEQFVQAVMQQQEQSQGMEQPMAMAANGGRIGYNDGGDPLTEFEIDRLGQMGYDVAGKGMEPFGGLSVLRDILRVNRADGGMAGMSVPGYGTPAGTNQFGYPSGGTRVNAAEGGIMDTEEASEMIDMGGNEKDYRDEGGFVAMGGEERADDVPARLSKNEFVFTADAVRNAGGGDIDRGSEVMQNLMDNLEQGGQVSEDSQGLGGGEEMMSEEIIEEPNGAQAMYEQQQALQSRIA